MAKSYIHELGDRLSNGFTADNLPTHIKEIAPVMYNDGSNNFNSIQGALNGKADKVSGATAGDVATLDANGNLVDSGKTLGKSVPANAVFTDTKQEVALATTTKAFITGVSTTPTSTAQALTGLADTGVYLTTTAGELNATQYKVNEHCTMKYNSTKSSLDFTFS